MITSSSQDNLRTFFPFLSDVVGFGHLTASLSASDAVALLDKLHILVDFAFSADGLFMVEQSSDSCRIVTGLLPHAPKKAVPVKPANKALDSVKDSSRASSGVADDAGYETKESEDEQGDVPEQRKKPSSSGRTASQRPPDDDASTGNDLLPRQPQSGSAKLSSISTHLPAQTKVGRFNVRLPAHCLANLP